MAHHRHLYCGNPAQKIRARYLLRQSKHQYAAMRDFWNPPKTATHLTAQGIIIRKTNTIYTTNH